MTASLNKKIKHVTARGIVRGHPNNMGGGGEWYGLPVNSDHRGQIPCYRKHSKSSLIDIAISLKAEILYVRVMMMTTMMMIIITKIFYSIRASNGIEPPHYRGFTITLRHTIFGWSPLDE
jgi:hypothetical protein